MLRYRVTQRDINNTNERTFYTPKSDTLILENASLNLTAGEIGSFQFTIPKTHPYRNDLEVYQSVFEIYDNYGTNNKIFSGRLISMTEAFNGSLSCEVEGYGAYLDDVVITAYVHTVNNVRDLIQGIINQHNNALDTGITDGVLTLGEVEYTVGSMFNFVVDYGTTKEALDKLVEQYGGYYHVDGYGMVNYYTTGDTASLNTQEVWYGKNLVEHVKEVDRQEIYSRVYPFGGYFREFNQAYEQEDDREQSYHERVKLDSTGTGIFTPYVENARLRQMIGIRSTCVIDDDIKGYDAELEPEGGYDPEGLTICASKLQKLAEDYLQNYQWRTVSIKVNAVDLSYANDNIEPFRLGQRVRIHSKPTDLDVVLPLTSMDIDLLNPSNNSYEFGNSFKGSLTKRLRR